MALLRKFTGPVRITFKKVSLALSRYFMGVLVPSSGSYYLSGSTNYTSADSNGLYLVGGDTSAGRFQKIDNDGTLAFQIATANYVNSPGDSTQYYTVLYIDGSNNKYTGGYFSGPAGNASWITKYSSSGSLTWSTNINYLIYDMFAITTDSSGNVYFGGKKNSSTGFDGAQRFAMASLNSSGDTIRWQNDYGTGAGIAGTFGYGLSTYSTFLYAVGIHYNTSYVQKGWLTKFSQSAGGIQTEYIYSDGSRFTSLIQNASGDCYIGGSLNSPTRTLILKTDASGTKQWGTTITNNYTTTKIAMDSSENIYAICRSTDSILNISKYNSSGTIQWQRNLTFPSTITDGSISITPTGDIFIATQARDSGLTRYYPFVALLKPDGSGTGTYTVDGQSYTYAASSETVSTDTGSFSSTGLGLTGQARVINTMTPDSTTDNLTLIKTRT
jgi:hypothetical protein